MIRDLFDRSEVANLSLGQVAEFHMAPDGLTGFSEVRPIGDFLRDWDYALLGRRWDEPVDESEMQDVDWSIAYIAVVHQDGAYLVEVDSAGVSR